MLETGHEDEGREAPAKLPPLLRGQRRTGMVLLVVTALSHAAFAMGAGLLVGRLVAGALDGPGGTLGLLAACLAGLAGTRYLERVLAERLGQDYVHELRLGLVESALTAENAPSLGITIARATNDLSSVRNWVAQGIAPLVAAVPLVAGSAGVLWAIAWQLGMAVLVPVALLGLALAVLARPAFGRARELRRRRGGLAARITDTVHAGEGILAAGGLDRELRQLDKAGTRVAEAAVSRASLAGVLRAAAMTTPVAASGAVAAVGALGVVGAADVATGLMVVGILGAPIGELGRVVEFRQNFKAARRIIGPSLATANAAGGVAGPAPSDPAVSRGRRVLVRGLSLDGQPVPPLHAEPGDRILVDSASPARLKALFRALSAPGPDSRLSLCVDGRELCTAGPKTRRRSIGYAAAGVPVERGTVARAVRYRRPDLDPEAGRGVLSAVGLADRVDALPEGERTVLRRGGEPLAGAELARLRIARAMLGDPPLLLLDRVDAELDADGAEMLRRLLQGYPGVLVFTSVRPDDVAAGWRRWSIDGPPTSSLRRPEP